jgi:hypothetical protein
MTSRLFHFQIGVEDYLPLLMNCTQSPWLLKELPSGRTWVIQPPFLQSLSDIGTLLPTQAEGSALGVTRHGL